MIVLAVDPGKVTGVAVWNDRQGLHYAGQLELYPFQCWAEETIRTYAGWGIEVVCESFVITAKTASKSQDAHWAFGGIETLRYWCTKYDVDLHLQSPSRKSFADDLKLKRLGWYQGTPGGHRNDAVRHLVVRLANTKRLDLSKLTG